MNKLLIKDIDFYTKEKENQFFERKSAKIKPTDILRHLVGFANADGGQLVIGIEDNGTISGFKVKGAYSIDEYKKNYITYLVETPIKVILNTIPVKNINNQDDEILIMTVDAVNNKVIKSNDGRVYLRQLDKTIELKYEQIMQLEYDRGQRSFEDEKVESATIKDLDENLLQEYKKIMKVEDIETIKLLEARNLIKGDTLTNAGILLFGKNPTKFLPQARLRVIKYDGLLAKVGKDINIIKEKTFDGAIPTIIKQVKEFINTQLREF